MRSLLPSLADLRPVRDSWNTDIVAGVTVGIVALPLALAFGASAGLGPAAGLVTAIVAGFLAAVFGGSNVQVSGPTGAMVVVLAPVVATHGTGAVTVVAILGGLLVVAGGFLRLGRFIAMVPWPVIEGFTFGIAIVIALQQVPALLGVHDLKGTTTLEVAWNAVERSTWDQASITLLVAGLVAAVMVLIQWRAPRMPASLIAIVTVTLLTEFAGLDAPRIGALPDTLPLPSLPEIDTATLRELLGPAVAVALLAAIESLLSAKVAAGLADTGDLNPDRELVGQGIASIGSGLFGGMPATGAIARTAVNVTAGARSRLAAAVHALVLLLIVTTASGLVGKIPLAALAGVLLVVCARMVDREAAVMLARVSRSALLVFTITAIVTVVFDLIVAIQIGIAIAAVLVLRSLASTTHAEREPLPGDPQPGDERIALFRLDGSAFFGAADKLADQIAATRDIDVVILRMSHLTMLDTTGARRLAELITTLERRGVTVIVKGLQERHRSLASGIGVLDALRHRAHAVDDLETAIEHARSHVRRRVP
ncbi:SulP family inorganic anion transporter [uncultured Aeromicrobium sp.]|uniref:SulP family inorganic anion transporter n=1 Tax=uncultured Aeromicrobium sp. TaxID=337820 RepID=UPI0025FDCD5E|nr:SulP family inorganic anion transporter [uncultured Aeromicrobium sp.]